jgi:FADH2 O2-dependent halogenase
MTSGEDMYDVIVLGTGLTGSLLGTVLAACGLRVLLTDDDIHPKCEPGEVLPHDVSTILRRIADRYRVPAVKTLSRYTNCRDIAGPMFGASRYTAMTAHHSAAHHSAAHHSAAHHGAAQHGAAQHGAAQTTTVAHVGKAQALAHLYRPASDGYLFYAAVLQGCDARQGWAISAIELSDDEVTVTGAGSQTVRGRYLVDTTPAPRSPLPSTLDLLVRASVPGHGRRLLWTHLAGVTDLSGAAPAGAERAAGQGSTCHVFGDGWLWLAPFNNDQQSRNPLCAVGLVVGDESAGRPADSCFAEAVDRIPGLAGQLADAVPVREWETVSPLGYAVDSLHGKRWCLIGPAAGAVDPLFGGNFRLAARAVEAVVPCLLAGRAGDGTARARFDGVERMQHDLIDLENASSSAAYAAVGDKARWELVVRAWLARVMAATHPDGASVAGAEAACRRLLEAAVSDDAGGLQAELTTVCQEAGLHELADTARHEFRVTYA